MHGLHLYELPFIKLLQEIRNPFLDSFFLFVNFLDTGYLVFFLIPIVWMGYNWKWGVRLLFILFLNFYLNALFKTLFHQPRPFHLDPTLAVIQIKGGGMPSGGAQNAMLYLGLIVGLWKNKKWAWALGLFLFLSISFSRVYLGVHFFSDVLGGYIIGAFLLWIFYYLFPKIEKYLKKTKDLQILICSFFLATIMFLSLDSTFVKMLSISSFFVTLGLIISKKYDLLLSSSSTFLEGFLRTLLTWTGIGILALSLAFSFDKSSAMVLFAVALLSLWQSCFASLLWKKTFAKLKRFKK